MPYAYRPMEPGDYDEILTLWRAVPGVGLSGADSRENIERYLTRNPGQSFVCLSEGKIIGTILCGSDGRRAYIHHTAVAPAHRRQGIAAELVRLALARQKDLGLDKCHLFIFSENDSGKAFWRALGFQARQDIEIMSKNL